MRRAVKAILERGVEKEVEEERGGCDRMGKQRSRGGRWRKMKGGEARPG